jgi:hypothetical protein
MCYQLPLITHSLTSKHIVQHINYCNNYLKAKLKSCYLINSVICVTLYKFRVQCSLRLNLENVTVSSI